MDMVMFMLMVSALVMFVVATGLGDKVFARTFLVLAIIIAAHGISDTVREARYLQQERLYLEYQEKYTVVPIPSSECLPERTEWIM